MSSWRTWGHTKQQQELQMSLAFVVFVFIGLHLFFLSIEMGWKYMRLRRIGQNCLGIVVKKETKGLNKNFIFYEFLALNTNEGGNKYVIRQRITVPKRAFSNYAEGELLEIRYVADNPRNNIVAENTPDARFCGLAICVVSVLSIPWVTMPFTWALWFKEDHYTLGADALITFGAAFSLWAISRLLCCKCYRASKLICCNTRSSSYQKREATARDLQVHRVEFQAAVYHELHSGQDQSSIYSDDKTHNSSIKISVTSAFSSTRARSSTSHSVQSNLQ